MYRLICPLVDRAAQRAGLTAVFEYKVLGVHGKTIKPDIALLAGEQAAWFIDAKAYGQAIGAGDVEKYRHRCARMAVTNGWSWLFVVDAVPYRIGLLHETDVNPVGWAAVLRALTATDIDHLHLVLGRWADGAGRAPTSPARPERLYRERGTRVSHPEAVFDTAAALVDQALQLPLRGAVQAFMATWRERAQATTSGITYRLRASKCTAWRGETRIFRLMLDTTNVAALIPEAAADLCQGIDGIQRNAHHNTPGWIEVKVSAPASAAALAACVAAWLR